MSFLYVFYFIFLGSQPSAAPVSFWGTWHLWIGPDRLGTRRWPSESAPITPSCTGATSSGIRTLSTCIRTGNSFGSATFTGRWISSSAMRPWCFKTAAFTPERRWSFKRTQSRPRTGRIPIRTLEFPSTLAGFWPPPIWRRPQLPPTQRIWVVPGNYTLELCTCSHTLGATCILAVGWNGTPRLHLTPCITVSIWTMGRVGQWARGWPGLDIGS